MPGSSRLSRGPDLPYEPLAAVEPCPSGWLLATAKLVGVNAHVDGIRVAKTFREILDHTPTFSVITVHMPIGLPTISARGGRSCEREARKLLGWPRQAAILSAPTKAALEAPEDYEKAAALNGGHLDYISWRMIPKIAEIAQEVQTYHQRFVYEVSPEMTFYQLNGRQPLRFSKRTEEGQQERREALGARVQGVQRIYQAKLPRVRPWHLIDVAASMWTARLIAGRGAQRLPEMPEWNDEGLRMEILR